MLLGRGACASREERAEGKGVEVRELPKKPVEAVLAPKAPAAAEAVSVPDLRRPGERVGEEKERR